MSCAPLPLCRATLIVVGHVESLQTNPRWSALVSHARKQHCMFKAGARPGAVARGGGGWRRFSSVGCSCGTVERCQGWLPAQRLQWHRARLLCSICSVLTAHLLSQAAAPSTLPLAHPPNLTCRQALLGLGHPAGGRPGGAGASHPGGHAGVGAAGESGCGLGFSWWPEVSG